LDSDWESEYFSACAEKCNYFDYQIEN